VVGVDGGHDCGTFGKEEREEVEGRVKEERKKGKGRRAKEEREAG
jgi:hypothetical protein